MAVILAFQNDETVDMLVHQTNLMGVKGAQSQLNSLKSLAKLFNCNPCQSSPSLTILVPLWFIIISLTFFYFCKALFSGYLQLNGNFVDAKNNSKIPLLSPF